MYVICSIWNKQWYPSTNWSDLNNMLCPVQEHTGMEGVDIIIEMLSNVNLATDLQLLSYGGRVMVGIFCDWL